MVTPTITFLTFAIFNFIDYSNVQVTQCDIIEINIMYDDYGRILFTQMICWDNTEENKRVQEWIKLNPTVLSLTAEQEKINMSIVKHDLEILQRDKLLEELSKKGELPFYPQILDFGNIYPHYNRLTGYYEVTYYNGIWHKIKSNHLMITRTQYDPELEDRRFLEPQKRKRFLIFESK